MSQSVRRPAAQRTQGSEKESQGKVFVAYMRRYAGALQTFLTELEIKFARVRDIIGPNVDQSGTFTQKFTDYPADAMAARTQAAEKLLKELYPNHTEITPLMTRFCRFLGGLGSHGSIGYAGSAWDAKKLYRCFDTRLSSQRLSNTRILPSAMRVESIVFRDLMPICKSMVRIRG